MEPQASSTTSQTNAPGSWPGGFGIFKPSKDLVLFNGLPVAVLVVLSLLVALFSPDNGAGSLLNLIIGSILSVALITVLFGAAQSKKVSLPDAISHAFSLLTIKYIALTLVFLVILVLSFLALIVPFFFVFPRLILAPYILVDTNCGVFEALQKSWAMTKGHAGKAWGIIGVSILFALLIIVLVGIYLSIMYIGAFVLFYNYLKSHQAAVPAQSAPTVTPPAAA